MFVYRYLCDEELPEGEFVVYDYKPKENIYTLTLRGNLKGMSGTVKVVAKNNGGEASCESQMTIKGRAPTFIEKPIKCTILEGKFYVY